MNLIPKIPTLAKIARMGHPPFMILEREYALRVILRAWHGRSKASMRKSWRDIKNQTMTRQQQSRAHRLAMQDVREFELRELREALHVTQVMLAKKLKTTQAAISRLEKWPQMHVSTMRSYIEALGGQVHTFATFPNLPTVSLTQFFRKKPTAMHDRKMRAARRTGQRVARRIGQSRAAV